MYKSTHVKEFTKEGIVDMIKRVIDNKSYRLLGDNEGFTELFGKVFHFGLKYTTNWDNEKVYRLDEEIKIQYAKSENNLRDYVLYDVNKDTKKLEDDKLIPDTDMYKLVNDNNVSDIHYIQNSILMRNYINERREYIGSFKLPKDLNDFKPLEEKIHISTGNVKSDLLQILFTAYTIGVGIHGRRSDITGNIGIILSVHNLAVLINNVINDYDDMLRRKNGIKTFNDYIYQIEIPRR